MTLEIEFTHSPETTDLATLSRGLTQALPEGISEVGSFGFFIRNHLGEIIAGASGNLMFGSIYTSLLWVSPDLRNQGYGRRLMQSVEKLGKDSECSFATLNTFSFQALPFYLSLGYFVEFERKGYVQSAVNYFLRKQL